MENLIMGSDLLRTTNVFGAEGNVLRRRIPRADKAASATVDGARYWVEEAAYTPIFIAKTTGTQHSAAWDRRFYGAA
ncbi:MAG: hypothetical protein ACYC8W_05600 [Candidatus Tyrphobacter sp.]